ncbi:FG-GAP-like repeat-containing protein [Streptomyces sp. NPDC058662]|uniref:FG-GAP-like repeat-containing protein n=1 Tax=Streptomyces sp. NPDC058662 TaxID=3346583 RepID=UPI003661CA80
MKRHIALLGAAAAAFSALIAVPAPAQAADPAVRPAPREIRVVSWNICGEAGGSRGAVGYCPYRNEPQQKVDQVKQLVDEQRADVVMLQEACGTKEGTAESPRSHEAMLRVALGAGWSFRHAVGARPDGTSNCRGSALGGDLGVLIAVKGAITSAAAENTVPAKEGDNRTLPVLCATVAGWSTAVCTTHILPEDPADKAGSAARATAQNENVKAFLDRHAPDGVVLGGDFNSKATVPQAAPLAGAYDRCIDGNTHHGWSVEGKFHTWHAYDHLFTTKAVGGSRFASCAIDTTRMDTTANETTSGAPDGYSDHAPVIGVLRGAPVAGDMNGDGRPDLVAVDTEGRLRFYRGYGNGAVTGSPAVIGTGGWSGAAVSHRGDWTGNGTEDLVARVGTELRVYPGSGDGTVGSPVRIGTGFPADAQVVAVGDLTGDHYPDLVATIGDALWLYAGDPAANPGVKPGVRISDAGWAPMTLTAPGDADRDGHPDLLARDTRDGSLWLHRGRADSGLDAPTQYGYGYGTANRPLIAGAADADGNGTVDLWTTTNEGTGTLLFYAGATNGAGDPVDGARSQVGLSGWNTIRAIS